VAKGGTMLYAAMYPNTYEMPLNLYKFCYANELTVTGFYVSPIATPGPCSCFPE
jgi:(R,R)-butanediol dehydrogenase/meso-butanediol dehydrogenase/diacetyl reductase/L-iditol 2-dehydrogenase